MQYCISTQVLENYLKYS